MVLLHLRIAHVVYPVRRVLVDNAPAHGQGMGVTHICLGVPLGYGVTFPGRRFEQQAAPRKQHETEFKRILKVEKSWKNWRQKGKQLSAEELHVHLGMPSL